MNFFPDILTATKFSEFFSGKKPCQNIKILQRFGDSFSLGVSG
jgi:hypothetical protein